MNNNDNFIQESTEWMKELNYCLMTRSGDGSWLHFISNDLDSHNPAIMLYINTSGERKMRIEGGNLKMLLTIKSPELPFKHPDTQKFIEVASHYAEMCDRFPPWS